MRSEQSELSGESRNRGAWSGGQGTGCMTECMDDRVRGMVVLRVWFGPELQWEMCPSRWQNCTSKGGVETTHLRFMSRTGSSVSLAEYIH
jgi:hypothetical protein